MNTIYLIAIILGVSGQNILKKMYSKKTAGQGVYTYTLITALTAMLFFILTAKNLQWEPALLLYSLLFAVSFGAASIFSTLAMACGPLSLTSLISSFSLMIPTFYGLIFLKEPISFGLLPGLILLVGALLLINKKSADSPVTAKWLLFVLITFAGNGMCSVVQKMQQSAFSGSFKNEFMILSMSMVSVIMLSALLLKERREAAAFARSGLFLGISCGLLNGTVNLFVMILSGLMSVSLMFPLVSVGGIVVSFLVSILFYKEKLTKAQYIGFLLGIAAIVFLNL